MNTLRNRVQLIGRLGMNPEIRNLESGNKVANFTIATSETYKNAKGERVENTEWHNIVAWNKTAEIVEKHLEKGKEIALKGKLFTETYTDKDGNKRYATKIKCTELLMFGSKS